MKGTISYFVLLSLTTFTDFSLTITLVNEITLQFCLCSFTVKQLFIIISF